MGGRWREKNNHPYARIHFDSTPTTGGSARSRGTTAPSMTTRTAQCPQQDHFAIDAVMQPPRDARPEHGAPVRYGEHVKYLDVDGIGRVSRIGLGTLQFGSPEWGYGDQYASGAARDIVQRALALGVTLFDTAERYGLGKSERILGEALGDKRADVAVASKISPVAPFPPVVKQRERASARRLQLDRIPLYQIHWPPRVPDSVIMPGMRSLLERGDIAATGVSNYSLSRWQKADVALGRPVISNQVYFSLAHPDALDDLVPFAERENRIVIAYSPLAQGLLGGKYGLHNRPGNDVRAVNPLFGTENLRRAEPLLQTLRDVAREADAKPAQVALAWLISLPGVVAIPGASSVDQLESNVAAADIELTAGSRNALTDAARTFRPVSVPISRKQILWGYPRLLIDTVRLYRN
jgi:aryl-alcohol dehydrogenase-like predicted oxidoreductase